ncbi:MAG: hypothetical protein GY861_10965 [bacterium]|nr:hypothetical protein [bacterium]
MAYKNTKAEYLLEDVTFEHEDAHLAYTLGSGAASKMNEAYLLKGDDLTLSEEEEVELTSIIKAAEGDLPNSAFAYVPDPDKTSTRKLRIDDANHTRAAVAALGEGFRGDKVEIPEQDLPAVKRKVKSAYEKFFPENEVPDVLKSLENNNDALSVSKTNQADTGESIKENSVTDKVELSKSELDDLLKMKEQLAAYQEKEAVELKKSKEDIVKSATFIESQEAVVEALIKSEDKELIEGIIIKAVEAIEKAKEEVKAEMQTSIDEALEKASKAEEKAEMVKSEFAEPAAIEGDNSSLEDGEKEIKKSNSLANFIKENYNK